MGPLLAERLSLVGLKPFDRKNVLHASRQIAAARHYFRVVPKAVAAPQPPLPRETRVFVAMCSTSEREDFYAGPLGATAKEANPQRVRDFYGSNLATELHIDGNHFEACTRCACNRDPAFTARLASFSRAIEAAATSGSRVVGSSSATARLPDRMRWRNAAESLVATVRANFAAARQRRRSGKTVPSA